MSNESQFLASIAATPDDLAPRLAYADWLEEQGNPGALFLRAECELLAIPPGQPVWHDTFVNYRKTRQALPAEWCDRAGGHSMDYWLSMSARSAWTRLDRWFQSHAPCILELFEPGASAEQIEAVERTVGQRLPADVRAALAIHNGCPSILLGDDLLSTARIIEDWQAWRGLEEYNERFAEGMESVPSEAIVLEYANAGWIPLTNDRSGSSFVGVDFSPGRAGTLGQIINFGRDHEQKTVLASHWSDFLAAGATFFESGAVPIAQVTELEEWDEMCDDHFNPQPYWWPVWRCLDSSSDAGSH